MSIATQNLIAVTPGGDITDDMIAGYYVFYSIPEEPVALNKVRKAFKDNGLDVDRLPKARRPEHVMQDACTKAARVVQNGHRVEIRAQRVGRTKAKRQDGSDGTFEIYQMTKHVQDLSNRVVDHEKDLRVMYDFEHGELVFEPLAPVEEVYDIIKDIQDYYDAHQQRLPGRGVRTIMRHYIEAAGAEHLRDGVYFIARKNRISTSSKLYAHHGTEIDGADFINAVHATLRQLYGREPEFHPIPCINDEGQRAFLKRKFVENCADDCKSFRDECIELVAGKDQRERGFRTDLRARLVQRRKEMDLRRQKFAEILGETLEELDRDMGLADKALAKFLSEADL